MYDSAVTVFSILALSALWFASYGGFHQVLTNARTGNTEAITPARFSGVCVANTVWVLYACSLEQVNIPLSFGCAAWVVSGALNLFQMMILPPKRGVGATIMMLAVLLLSLLGNWAALFSRTSIMPWRDTLEWASVTATILFVHSGQVLQLLHTRKRSSLEGLSRWDVFAPFVDWSVFIVYSCLIGPFQYWPILLNSLLGFLTSGARVVQFFRLQKGIRQ